MHHWIISSNFGCLQREQLINHPLLRKENFTHLVLKENLILWKAKVFGNLLLYLSKGVISILEFKYSLLLGMNDNVIHSVERFNMSIKDLLGYSLYLAIDHFLDGVLDSTHQLCPLLLLLLLLALMLFGFNLLLVSCLINTTVIFFTSENILKTTLPILVQLIKLYLVILNVLLFRIKPLHDILVLVLQIPEYIIYPMHFILRLMPLLF